MHCLASQPILKPEQLEALARYRNEGRSREWICRALGISKATYFRRLADIKRLAAQSEDDPCDP